MPYNMYNFAYSFVTAFIPLAVVMLLVLFSAVLLQNVHISIRNNRQPVIPVEVKVVTKRVDVSYLHTGDTLPGHSHTTCYVLFSFDNGQRLELKVPAPDYETMREGEAGTLYFQGSRYVSFNHCAREFT